MNRFKFFCVGMFLFTITACSTAGKSGEAQPQAALDTQLKVISGAGHLKAKLSFKNLSAKEIVINDLNSKNFKVEMLDGKPMTFKGSGTAVEPIKIAPGQTGEAAFNLQDSYPFWDRRTKYKIWYEAPNLKSNTVQVWF